MYLPTIIFTIIQYRTNMAVPRKWAQIWLLALPNLLAFAGGVGGWGWVGVGGVGG